MWQFVGIPMMLFYAALIGIPDELIEAARVDGASPWRIFWRIKLPLILPTVGIVSILTFVGNFNAFDLIYTVKGAHRRARTSPPTSWARSSTAPFSASSCSSATRRWARPSPTMMFLIILFGVLLYLFGLQRRLQTYGSEDAAPKQACAAPSRPAAPSACTRSC